MSMERACVCSHPDLTLKQASYILSFCYHNACTMYASGGRWLDLYGKQLIETFLGQKMTPQEYIPDILFQLECAVTHVKLLSCAVCGRKADTSATQDVQLFQFKSNKNELKLQLFVPIGYLKSMGLGFLSDF